MLRTALGLAACACLAPSSPQSTDSTESAESGPIGFAVYVLSRGKGVPEEARAVLERAEAALEAARRESSGVRLTRSRIGLEGETRLCAEFDDPAVARRLLEQVRRDAEGVDLVNVVVEPCEPSAKRGPP